EFDAARAGVVDHVAGDDVPAGIVPEQYALAVIGERVADDSIAAGAVEDQCLSIGAVEIEAFQSDMARAVQGDERLKRMVAVDDRTRTRRGRDRHTGVGTPQVQGR